MCRYFATCMCMMLPFRSVLCHISSSSPALCVHLSLCSIFKFLRNPRKPVILAMSRPDAKKNITTLVKAYGKNKALREIANLVLVMGNREVCGVQHSV